VIALFSRIIVDATILILAAALSPAFAHRRDLLEARPHGPLHRDRTADGEVPPRAGDRTQRRKRDDDSARGRQHPPRVVAEELFDFCVAEADLA
jgi:hypothetical protein